MMAVRKPEYVAVFQDGWCKVKDLTKNENNVWNLIFSEMKYNNWFNGQQEYISDKLGIAQPTVSLALNTLISKDIIVKIKINYSVNPYICWAGTSDNLKMARTIWDKK